MPTPPQPTDPATPAPVTPGPAPEPELPDPVGIEPELQPETRVLTSTELGNLKGLSVSNADACVPLKDDRAKCQFSFTLDPLPEGIVVGSVLVADVSASTPNGLLVKITKISGNTISATEAALGDALKQGEFSGTFALMPNKVQSQSFARGVSLRGSSLSPQGTDFAFNIKHVELAEGVYADGNVAFSANCGAGAGLTYKEIWGVPVYPNGVRFEAVCGVSESASLDITASKGAELNKTAEIAAFTLEPITFTIGPVPVVIVPHISVGLGASGKVSADMSFGAQQHFTARAGVKYDDGFKNVTEHSKGFDIHASSLKGSVEAKAAINLSQGLALYGLAGPVMTESGYLNFKGALKQKPLWCLDAGVRGDVSIDIDLKIKRLRWGPSVLFDESGQVGCAANTPPALAISSPGNGATVYDGQLPSSAVIITDSVYPPFPGFKAVPNDLEDGPLTVSWRSDVEGDLGMTLGDAPLDHALTEFGTQTITASVRDGDGAEAKASIVVNVAPSVPIISVAMRNSAGEQLTGNPIVADYGDTLYFTGTVDFPPGLPPCCQLIWNGNGHDVTEQGNNEASLELTQEGNFAVHVGAIPDYGEPNYIDIPVSVGPPPTVIKPQFSRITAVRIGEPDVPLAENILVYPSDVVQFSLDYKNYDQAQIDVSYQWGIRQGDGEWTVLPVDGQEDLLSSVRVWTAPKNSSVNGLVYTVHAQMFGPDQEFISERTITVSVFPTIG